MEDFRIKRWVTNCRPDDAFERLVAACAEDPDGFYEIGPPRETRSYALERKRLFSGGTLLNIPLGGYTAAELEKMGLRGIYEVFPPDAPDLS